MRRRPPHVLADRPFRRLWTATSICSLGDWLNLMALTALAGHLTQGSGYRIQGLAIGGAFAAWLLPIVLLGPLGGALADRFDRRMTMVSANFARFVLILSIAIVGVYEWLIIAAFLAACANLLWVSARDATMPNLLPADRLEEGRRVGLLATYGAAPVAALVFAVLSVIIDMVTRVVPAFTVGPAVLALFLGALAYWAPAISIFTLQDLTKAREPISTPSMVRQVTRGWRSADRTVRRFVIGMLTAVAAGGAVIGVAAMYVSALGGGDAGYGMLFGAVFAGVALGVFFGGRLLRELSRRRLFGLSIVCVGVLLAGAGLIHNLVIVVVLTVALGGCAGVAWIAGYALIGLEGGDALRGRVFTFLHALAGVILPVVIVLAAMVAGLFGVHVLGLAGGMTYRFDGAGLVLVVVALIVIAVGAMTLRRMDDRAGIPLFADLAAALRGRRYVRETTEPPRGLFVAFEGGEGSGKTTQARLLAIWLRDQGFDVELTREPGSTKVGMRLRAILLDSAHRGLTARAETLLYAADRAEHVEKVIRPGLYRGAMVVCDRYVDSSLAYQGAGRELGLDEVAEINSWATGELVPDLTVLIDLPPRVGLSRFASPADRIEAEPLEFHERVRREFRTLAAAAPDRYLVLDGTRPPNEIARLVQDRVREILPDPVPRETEDITGTMPAIRD